MFKKELIPGPRTRYKSSVQKAIYAKVAETYPGLKPFLDEIMPKKVGLDAMKVPDRVTVYALATTPPTILFWQHMDDPIIPHLKLVHRYPACFSRVRIDRGAIRFVLSGAALMVPGLVSPGGRLPRSGGVVPEIENGNKSTISGSTTGSIKNEDHDQSANDETNHDQPTGTNNHKNIDDIIDSSSRYGTRALSAGEVVVVEAEGKTHACMVGVLKLGTDQMPEVGRGVAIENGHYLGDGLWRLSLH